MVSHTPALNTGEPSTRSQSNRNLIVSNGRSSYTPVASVATAGYPISAQMYGTSNRTGYEQTYAPTTQANSATTFSYTNRTQVCIRIIIGFKIIPLICLITQPLSSPQYLAV